LIFANGLILFEVDEEFGIPHAEWNVSGSGFEFQLQRPGFMLVFERPENIHLCKRRLLRQKKLLAENC
jgi:hypothetical protein